MTNAPNRTVSGRKDHKMAQRFKIGDIARIRNSRWLVRIVNAIEAENGSWMYEVHGLDRCMLLKREVKQNELQLA